MQCVLRCKLRFFKAVTRDQALSSDSKTLDSMQVELDTSQHSLLIKYERNHGLVSGIPQRHIKSRWHGGGVAQWMGKDRRVQIMRPADLAHVQACCNFE